VTFGWGREYRKAVLRCIEINIFNTTSAPCTFVFLRLNNLRKLERDFQYLKISITKTTHKQICIQYLYRGIAKKLCSLYFSIEKLAFKYT
jgi:hypothetical protein